jgi:hypothetical protein
MNGARSILDDRAVDPHTAKAALDRLARRVREGALATCLTGALAVTAVLLGHRALALALAAGAVAGACVGLFARSDRQALLRRLAGQRSAYDIPEVARAAAQHATLRARRQLAGELTALVLQAHGLELREPLAPALPERVTGHAGELLAVAFLLARADVDLHPSSVVLVERLLFAPLRSPLYNPQVADDDLRIALQRVRASVAPSCRAS